MAPRAAISANANGKRRYQRGLSKLMMKLSRYRLNGSTQRNGMTATSWQILLVVASSRMELHAGSSHQRIFWLIDSFGMDLSGSACGAATGSAFHTLKPQTTQPIA